MPSHFVFPRLHYFSMRHKHDRSGALTVHDSMKKGLEEPAEDWCLGVTSMKADYPDNFDDCVGAARQALTSLGLVVTGGELHPLEACIDARAELADLVHLSIKATGGWTRVTFMGRDWTDDGKDLIRKLKDEFETCLNKLSRERS